MKVLHLCFSNGNGGAGLGASRLHQAMREQGIQSQMLVANRADNDPDVFTLGEVGLGPEFKRVFHKQRLMKKLYRADGRLAIRSINLPKYNLSSVVNSWDADIIQMHWVGNGFLPVCELPKFNKPVFWKLPDMWAFSGAEHYREEILAQRHISGYSESNRPKVFSGTGVDLDARTWAEKQRQWQDLPLTVITPSRWLGREAHFSQLFGRYDIHVVPNPLDTSLFKPLLPWRKKNLRADFGLSADKHLVAFVSMGAEGKRKGYHYLETALLKHLPAVVGPEQIEFFVLGSDQPGEQTIGDYKIVKLGRIDVQREYAELLAMGDSCAFPTEIDNLPNVVTECMACGLPVVSFDVGGVPDQIAHRQTGYLAKAYDAEDLANGIAWAQSHDDLAVVTERARNAAIAFTCQETAVSRYVSLYELALKRSRSGLDKLRPSSNSRSLFEHTPDDLTEEKPTYPVQLSQSPFLNDPAAIAGKNTTGKFRDRVYSPQQQAPAKIIIMEPAAIDDEDSSHNVGYLKDLSAALARHAEPGVEICWVTNRNGSLNNPYGPVLPLFPYSQYDAVRGGNDTKMRGKASRQTHSFEYWADDYLGNEKSVFDVFAKMESVLGPFTHRDSVFIPMADRLLIEAALMWRSQLAGLDRPALHIMIMFEKAKWLTGGYPFLELMTKLRNSQIVGKGIYLYAESEAFLTRLQTDYGLECHRMVYPVERTTDIDKLLMFNELGHEKIAAEQKYDVLRIAVLGRGRRDKGFALLPDIVREFNKLYRGEIEVEFVIQDGRQMDDLQSATKELESIGNVILLDEFISNDDFERHQDEANIVLLPYDREVYKIRGSSIMWRAVAHGKPLVVTRKSALVEALTLFNGIAAEPTGQSFANALVEIATNYTRWHTQALTAAAVYWTKEQEYIDMLTRSAIHRVPLNVAVISSPSDVALLRKLRRRGQQVVKWWLVPDDEAMANVKKSRENRVALTESQGVLEFASRIEEGRIVVPEPIAELFNKGVVDRVLVSSQNVMPLIEGMEFTGTQNEQPPILSLTDYLASSEFKQLKKIKNEFSVSEVRAHRSWGIKRTYKRSMRWLQKKRRAVQS